MRFNITSISSKISPTIHELYEQSFPEHERRPWKEQLQLVKVGKLQVDSISINEVFIGFIFYWQLNHFTFIEHFAIVDSARGKGAGSKILEEFVQRFQTIILETEPPEISSDALRRITFYQKAGFILFNEDYMQPSYVEGNPYFLMRLMHYNLHKTQQTFKQIKHEIYAAVYGIK